jgi:hypothetical protein
MSLTAVLTANAVLAVLFGIGFLLAPHAMLAAYGVGGDSVAAYLARLLGAAYIGIGLLCWRLRSEPGTGQVVALPLAIGNSLAFLAALYQAFVGGGNNLKWTTPVIFAYLALGFWLNVSRKPTAALSH